MNINQDKHFITLLDHSVSKESFSLFLDENLALLATVPQPSADQLPKYYESDDYISHTDGKRTLFEKAYHFVKGIALKQKTKLILKYQNRGALLDLGAGTGDFLNAAKAEGWQVTGVEPSEKAREIAAGKNLTLYPDTANLPDHSFDVITMWHVLEHVPDVNSQIITLKRLLKPGGTIVVAVPNYKSYDANYYGEYWAAYDVPRHLWHFSRTAIEKLFGSHGMVLKDVLPMKFDAFYVALLSEKYQAGKMNYFKAFRIGLRSNAKAAKTGEYSSLIYILQNKS
ncbi:Demethylmenaquinone methyltransferase [Flavobacterium longum]|uniref:class I SAM-dependent methyltransferase n=1 Tax=Flavobacterium longum TaxID=1299340 RepID=UPI0039E834F0